jgi:hypothetical protein
MNFTEAIRFGSYDPTGKKVRSIEPAQLDAVVSVTE